MPNASQRVLVEPYTMLSPSRLKALERSIRSVVNGGIPGDVVECGAAAGGSAALLAVWLRRLKSTKTLYLFDTFEGLPSPNENDPDYDRAAMWTGKCRGELEQVESLLSRLNVLDRAVLIKGKFQETLPTFDVTPLSFVHLDGDWYDSTRVCLEHLWDRISPGGILQIDDYGAWQGCQRAVDEFLEQRGLINSLQWIDKEGRWILKQTE